MLIDSAVIVVYHLARRYRNNRSLESQTSYKAYRFRLILQGGQVTFQKIMIVVIAVGITTLAGADYVGVAQTADTQTDNVDLRDAASTDDNMADFLESVEDVSADDRTYSSGGGGHERHLGLGFSHDMSSGIGLSSQSNDHCNGNGHSANRNGQGEGYEGYSSLNGVGHRHCGDPSPSD